MFKQIRKNRARRSRETLMERLEPRELFSTYIVTNLADHGVGSLRQAVLDTTTHPGADTINFAAGLHGTIGLTRGQITIAHSVTINGQDLIAISGNNSTRVLYVKPGVNATINGVTVENGNAAFGAGFFNDDTLNLNNDIITNNSGESYKFDGSYGGGGGLMNYGTANLNDTSVEHNTVSALDSSGNDGGGGIYNLGKLNVTNGLIGSNAANGGHAGNDIDCGGGLFNAGIATITGAAIAGNTGTVLNASYPENDFGTGVYNSGQLTVIASTINGNHQYGGSHDFSFGGGLYTTGTATLLNTTVANNQSGDGGGMTVAGGAATVVNCTVAGNVATEFGGGIEVSGGILKIGNTILATNGDQGEEQSPPSNADFLPDGGTLVSLGHNLVGSIGNSNNYVGSLWSATDIVGQGNTTIDPRLVALANNGGPTWTMAISTNSPAIDAGSNALASQYDLIADQRGDPRVSGGTVDIGAYEFQYIKFPIVPIMF